MSAIVNFKINEKKRTVVCIITAVNDVLERLEKYNLASDPTVLSTTKTYVGIAKCSSEDEWDETLGKRLAEYRAARKRQTAVNNDLKRYIERYTKHFENLNNYGLLKEPHNPLKPKEKEII